VTDTRSTYSTRTRNPDVLSCIANLSSDEVFTPPEFANEMLDRIGAAWSAANGGADLWADPTATFLDPFTKSGVFLREITKRMVDGLQVEIPDLPERVDHILTRQVFGIGITEITALLARRSLYCSKDARGEHSIARSFTSSDGNVWFERSEHSWVGGTEWAYTADADGKQIKRYTNGRCRFCSAPQVLFDRDAGLEAHATPFLHTDDVKSRISEVFGAEMQFDVVVGNPPYQMTGGGGGTNDSSIYHLFVQQAKSLEPRFLSMVIPSRWMAGGRGPGLAEFRSDFLGDRRVRTLVDFENAADAFPTVGIGGGICYFLWDRDNPGTCRSEFRRGGSVVGPTERDLNEFEIFVRDPRSVSILKKVLGANEPSFEGIVSGDTPFGLATNFSNFTEGAAPGKGTIRLYANKGTKRISGALLRSLVQKNTHLIDSWKVLVPKTGSGREREKTGVDVVLGPPLIAEPGSACTQTYVAVGPFLTEDEARNVEAYLRTRFARFLISLRKISQDTLRGVYRWVPVQEWNREWTDEALYEKYGVTDSERAYIESFIKPMNGGRPSSD
jgi:hypothetical protein